MFNATDFRARAKHSVRLDSYYRTKGFNAILRGLLADGVPEHEVMQVTRGKLGSTMLHDAFLLDFLGWIGGETYYRAIKKFVVFNSGSAPLPPSS